MRFVRERSLLEALASSLTELFAPKIREERIAGLLAHYDFANEATVAYFKRRLKGRRRTWTSPQLGSARPGPGSSRSWCWTPAFKTDVLWAQLDTFYHAYVEPGHIPPGASCLRSHHERARKRRRDRRTGPAGRGAAALRQAPRPMGVLAPERLFVLDAIAHEILKRCDGERAVAAIVDDRPAGSARRARSY